MITLYTITQCSWCTKVKRYLQQQNIEYTEVNVEEDKAAYDKMVALSKQETVPVLDIDGKIVVGFDRDKIDEYVKK